MMALSNGQYTRIKTALENAQRVGPDFQWRMLNEELSTRDLAVFLLWARDQINSNPQPHASTTAG